MWLKYGLKAQKLLSQGIALGIITISKAPCNYSVHKKTGDKYYVRNDIKSLAV